MMRYALMAEFPQGKKDDAPYVAWLATNRAAFPLTTSLTNALWFKAPSGPQLDKNIVWFRTAFGTDPVLTAVSEEELTQFMVMRRLYESTFS
jgi:hypothetical protein